MKTAVLDFLKKEHTQKVDRFNEALQLLMKSDLPPVMMRNYNVRGFTSLALDSLEYDIKKHYGITEGDIRNHIITQEEVEVVIAQATLDKDLFFAANKDVFGNILKDMNDTEKSGFKIYNRYPFLRTADCPNEFKVLTADAITAFHNFKEAHTSLFENVVLPQEIMMSNEDIFSVAAQLLENFELNRDIHAELEHYAEKGEILGEHEIFADYIKERDINALSDIQLKQKVANIASRISKKKDAIEKAKDAAKIAQLQKDKLTLENEKEYLSDKLAKRISKADTIEK